MYRIVPEKFYFKIGQFYKDLWLVNVFAASNLAFNLFLFTDISFCNTGKELKIVYISQGQLLYLILGVPLWG